MKKLDKSTLIGVGQDFERIRRITGYLVRDMGLWNRRQARRGKRPAQTPCEYGGKAVRKEMVRGPPSGAKR